MAPVDPDTTAQSNLKPIALFAGPVLLVTRLTLQILLSTRRAARSLPPSTVTRTQEPIRRRNAIVYSILAFLSLASVTSFAAMWRVGSYISWAEKGNHQTPGSLWTGWYGTGDEGVGKWRLGDWLSDTDLVRESDAIAVSQPETFLYTSQHFVGFLIISMFMGIEGRRRNLSSWTIASFVILSGLGSLSYALCLFFVTMLYTPLTLHNNTTPRHDTLFTPKPAALYVPGILALLTLNRLLELLAKQENITPLRIGYLAVPLYLAFAPQIIPLSWGEQHTSKASAHRSFRRAFHVFATASFILHWKLFIFAFWTNTPPKETFYDRLMKHSKPNRFLAAINTTAHTLIKFSTDRVISVTTSDVFYTTVSLVLWAFIRDLDVEALLDNSVLSFLAPPKTEKHVAFDGNATKEAEETSESEAAVPIVTPKKRGRPRRGILTNGDSTPTPSGLSPTATGTRQLRRSTRQKSRSDFEPKAEESFDPPTSAKREVEHTEADGAAAVEDLVHGGEATAISLSLAFLGGLGQLAASVLGAEATTVNE